MYWFHPNKKRLTKKSLQNKIEHDYMSTYSTFKPTTYRRLMGIYNLTNINTLTNQTFTNFYNF